MQKEEFYRLLENPAVLNNETIEGLKNLTIEYPHFQAVWMLYLKNLKITDNIRFDEILQKAAVRIPDRKQLHYFLKNNFIYHKSTTDQQEFISSDYDLGKEEEALHSGNSLIDKFLLSEQGPVRLDKPDEQDELPKASEYERIEKSTGENDEIITETLAMIYFEQKKYDKALDAFQKLSLKYPEKSVYFATRIEEIEKLKNI
ncbi:MAG: tetratricopeptide repeat protein [Prolixibacteraceae bacterium]